MTSGRLLSTALCIVACCSFTQAAVSDPMCDDLQKELRETQTLLNQYKVFVEGHMRNIETLNVHIAGSEARIAELTRSLENLPTDDPQLVQLVRSAIQTLIDNLNAHVLGLYEQRRTSETKLRLSELGVRQLEKVVASLKAKLKDGGC